MNNPILIDTNLLVYAKDNRSAFHTRTVHLLENYDGDLFTTGKNISEYLVVVTRGDQPVCSVPEALLDVDEFALAFEVLYPTPGSFQTFRRLLETYQPRGKKVHDYEIAAIALHHGIRRIATLNPADFARIAEVELITVYGIK